MYLRDTTVLSSKFNSRKKQLYIYLAMLIGHSLTKRVHNLRKSQL